MLRLACALRQTSSSLRVSSRLFLRHLHFSSELCLGFRITLCVCIVYVVYIGPPSMQRSRQMPDLALHVNVYERETQIFTSCSGGATAVHLFARRARRRGPGHSSSKSTLKTSSRRSCESGQCWRRASSSSTTQCPPMRSGRTRRVAMPSAIRYARRSGGGSAATLCGWSTLPKCMTYMAFDRREHPVDRAVQR